jgi:hypothetical protein
MVSATNSQDTTSRVASQKSQTGCGRKRPLTLLELPVDILQLILNEACDYPT